MKNFDSRVYSINDFLDWDEKGQLELSPKFQRRNVWSSKARSYLIDTIIRGKPIPKVFIRQIINPITRESSREVVDGQQRLRTIIQFIHDGFQISKKHNSTYGGYYFSQLGNVDEQIQTNILNYEISVDLLVNMDDSEVLDVFSRLNSYAITLNIPEKLNASHFGPFKTLCDKLAHSYNRFWIDNKILTEQQILRMNDVYLTADLIIASLLGIKSKKFIEKAYGMFENEFEHDPEEIEFKFHKTTEFIQGVFESDIKSSVFHRIHLFYTLFTACYHILFGLPDLGDMTFSIDTKNYKAVNFALQDIEDIFETQDKSIWSNKKKQFFDDCSRATTDAPVRHRRTMYVVDLLR